MRKWDDKIFLFWNQSYKLKDKISCMGLQNFCLYKIQEIDYFNSMLNWLF